MMVCVLRIVLVAIAAIMSASCDRGTSKPAGDEAITDSSALQDKVVRIAEGGVGTWLKDGPSDGTLVVQGSPDMSKPISLFWSKNDDRPHMLRLIVHAGGDGIVQVQLYHDSGQPFVMNGAYKSGENIVEIALPRRVDGSRVTILRPDGNPNFSISRMFLVPSVNGGV